LLADVYEMCDPANQPKMVALPLGPIKAPDCDVVKGNKILCKWPKCSDEGCHYELHWRIDQGKFRKVSKKQNDMTYTLQNPIPGQVYTFHYAICNDCGFGPMSPAKSIVVANPPSSPRCRAQVVDPCCIRIRWSAPSRTGGSAIESYSV